jgi:DNA-binding transcriptional regulator LsrR (DeoR family)
MWFPPFLPCGILTPRHAHPVARARIEPAVLAPGYCQRPSDAARSTCLKEIAEGAAPIEPRSRPARDGTLLNRTLMHSAAKLHYVDGLPQIEVARIMQVSTATVSRLIARARQEGIVRIQVVDPDEASGIGEVLRARLELGAVRVLQGSGLAALSAQVSALIVDAALAPEAVVVLGWGRTVQAVLRGGLPKIPGATVVPATGGLHEAATHFQINEFVRAAAEQMQGRPVFLHAPLVASAELRSVFASDPDASRVIDLWSSADAAILGIGGVEPSALPTVEAPGYPAGPVVGDVVRNYFDASGGEVRWRGQEALIAIGRSQLERIPLGIGVAAGPEKAVAIIGAARSGMINALVTDLPTAQTILALLDAAPLVRPGPPNA